MSGGADGLTFLHYVQRRAMAGDDIAAADFAHSGAGAREYSLARCHGRHAATISPAAVSSCQCSF